MGKPVTPLLAVDGIVVDGDTILLIRRRNPPFKGLWALPGGFVDVGETCEEACVREVSEETGLEVKIKKLVGVYSDPGRDPRGHTVSAVFLCEIFGGELSAGDDAGEARFFPLYDLPELAFDHGEIIWDARKIIY
ncbi:MAG: NUDIX hydrolase [Methanobacteriota archaeon]